MATHIERTTNAPRQSGVHPVILSRITRITPAVRLLTLALPYTIKFLPGQWVDLHIPNLQSPGGFTIISSPSSAIKSLTPTTEDRPAASWREKNLIGEALAKLQFSRDDSLPFPRPFIELAVQRTSNPPAQWLWQPTDSILGSGLGLRVGGSFTWPPPDIDPTGIRRVIFVAGGVGINPFISMLAAMHERPEMSPQNIEVLYSVRGGPHLQEALFLNRLLQLFAIDEPQSTVRRLSLFITGDLSPEVSEAIEKNSSDRIRLCRGRISTRDLSQTVKRPEFIEAQDSVAYVCGPGGFVDETVKLLSQDLEPSKVFFERWW